MKITCGGCGAEQQFLTWPSLDVDLNPEENQQLIRGVLNRFTCQMCGWSAQVEYPILYHDAGKRLMIYCVVGGNETPKMPLGERTNEYQLRVVGRWDDLREKAGIFDNLLDDRLVELQKALMELPAPFQFRFGGRRQDPQGKAVLFFVLLGEPQPRTFQVSEETFATFARSLANPPPPLESIAGKWLRVEGKDVEEVTSCSQQAPGTVNVAGTLDNKTPATRKSKVTGALYGWFILSQVALGIFVAVVAPTGLFEDASIAIWGLILLAFVVLIIPWGNLKIKNRTTAAQNSAKNAMSGPKVQPANCERKVLVPKDESGEPEQSAPPQAGMERRWMAQKDLPAVWAVGDVILDLYEVAGVLGQGGMGSVYLVRSLTTGMQFAIKRALIESDASRRSFLSELQTWIDLPDHPNLVPCRFFRTIGDEVLIFAEYVEGGSLKDWIDSRRLYEGGAGKALERILDTAIQFAWGLHCVHEMGLVHQDVKPANVMMAKEAKSNEQGLRAMVTDYGLARARAAGGEQTAADSLQSILLSTGGMTPAYCSPEQARRLKLDRRTDVWSWGVSVMEMFQGGVTWQSGCVAADALEAFLEHNGEEEGIPAMPTELAELLKDCFREVPAERWRSLDVVVQNLKSIYQTALGVEYGRLLDKVNSRTAPQVGAGERHGRGGHSWEDPRKWLGLALLAEGRDPAEADAIVARHGSSRRGHLVADLAVYDEARRIYERLITGGRKDLENELAELCRHAASVHETADDSSGALALIDRAVEIRERLVNGEGRCEFADDLAWAYNSKATAVMHLGDNRAAVVLYGRAIEIFERLVNVEGRRELGYHLAGFYMNKALPVVHLGDNREAVDLYDRAITILEPLVDVEGRRDLDDILVLASCYMNKASAVQNLGDHREAVVLIDQAIEIFKRLVNVEGRCELANELAGLYMNKANAFRKLGDNRAALDLYNQAIEIRERLVRVEGRRELADNLAMCYINKAAASKNLGDNRAALELNEQAIEILERLVNVEGRHELADNLARCYIIKARAVGIGDKRAAMDLWDRVIEILERLVNVEGRRELADNLAMCYVNKADVFRNSADNRAAVVLYDRAIEIRERLVNVDGRHELANELADNRTRRADLEASLAANSKELGDQ